MHTIPPELTLHIEKELDVSIQAVRSVGGGCIHHAQRLETNREPYFLKYNRLSQFPNFEVEAKGLQLLAEKGPLHTPQVIQVGQTETHAFLLLEWIESDRPAANYWAQLGTGLAQLHRQTHTHFGLAQDNYIGSLPQTNRFRNSWEDFFREERLEPMLDLASRKGLVDKGIRQQFDRLYKGLSTRFPQEPPALIHGDLWGGNLMKGPVGEPILVDPAVYYGHREMELAFMTLFDRQPPEFYEAYQAVFPLESDWESRIDLCNLYPLLVHVNLFGAGYLGAVKQILRKYV